MNDHFDLLVIIAHPDDEVFASGTICLCAELGLRIGLVCVTDGEGGSREILSRGGDLACLGEIRRLEMTLSAWALSIDKLWFLGREDIPPRAWSKGRTWDEPGMIADLAGIMQQAQPRLILTHGPLGGYGHPAHRRVNACAMGAANEVAFAGSIYSFCGQIENAFFSWRFDQPSDVVIDARGFLRRRSISLSYHQSEAQFFLRPYVPQTLRQFVSAAFGILASFSEAGRKRVPIGTPGRFFRRFSFEGLVLQRPPCDGAPHFFAQHFADDKRVHLVARNSHSTAKCFT
jgi:N-acetylglucosamine malate deacetylase 2